MKVTYTIEQQDNEVRRHDPHVHLFVNITDPAGVLVLKQSVGYFPIQYRAVAEKTAKLLNESMERPVRTVACADCGKPCDEGDYCCGCCKAICTECAEKNQHWNGGGHSALTITPDDVHAMAQALDGGSGKGAEPPAIASDESHASSLTDAQAKATTTTPPAV